CARGGGGYSRYPLSNWFDVW
nr:immunoglobulin heavy chain junction region [Macaca mulatta]